MGIGQKIKDAITPGSHKHDEGAVGTGLTSSDAGYGTTAAGTTGVTGTDYDTTRTSGAGYGTTGTAGVHDYGTTVGGDSSVERATEEAAAAEAAATGRPAVAQTVTTAEAAPVAGQETVCGQEFFTKTEDRPVITERVDYIKEHRPVEKEFVVETRATGVERQLPGQVEHLGTTERIVSEAVPKGPCE